MILLTSLLVEIVTPLSSWFRMPEMSCKVWSQHRMDQILPLHHRSREGPLDPVVLCVEHHVSSGVCVVSSFWQVWWRFNLSLTSIYMKSFPSINWNQQSSYMGVSKKWGTPKWMVYNGSNPIKMGWFGGNTPIFGNTSCFDGDSSAPMGTKTSVTKGSHRIRRRDDARGPKRLTSHSCGRHWELWRLNHDRLSYCTSKLGKRLPSFL